MSENLRAEQERLVVNALINEEIRRTQRAKLESFLDTTKSLIVSAFIMFYIISIFWHPQASITGMLSVLGSPVKKLSINILPNGAVFDMYCYVSEKSSPLEFEYSNLVWQKNELIYSDWNRSVYGDTYTHLSIINASRELRNNGSLYLHVYVLAAGKSPDPRNENYAGQYISYGRKMLSKYKTVHYQKTQNLLTGEMEKSKEEIRKEVRKDDVVSHWHPNLTINLVIDQTNWIQGDVPEPFNKFVDFLPDGSCYKPIVFINDYWDNTVREYVPIHATTTQLELHLTFKPLSLFRWQLFMAQEMLNGRSLLEGEEQNVEQEDMVKELLMEMSLYLSALSMTVYLLHSMIAILKFKNDIQFWYNRQSLDGLSVRSVLFNIFQSIVVLLYVLHNETNMMFRFIFFISLFIEIWKINKVMDVQVNRGKRIFGIPLLTFAEKRSYLQTRTRQYDIVAFHYLSWIMPVLVGYGILSLLYQEHQEKHNGWYSFILNMMYGHLRTFGFIMMTPQLFINYKLKSVAYRWMIFYNFLSTLTEDFLAFVIKVPTMYRLGCFGYEIVFIIYLYQLWYYKVDN